MENGQELNSTFKRKKTKKSKIVVWIISAAFFLIAFSLLIVSIVFQKNDKAYLFGYRIYYVSTGSMDPDIPQGSIAIVKKTPPEQLKIGDFISFISPDPNLNGAIITHAIYDIEEGENGPMFTTKGTANPVPDTYKVDADGITGKVVYHSEKLGSVFSALSNRTLLFVLTIVPLAIIVLYSLIELIINIFKSYPESDGEKADHGEAAKRSIEKPVGKKKFRKDKKKFRKDKKNSKKKSGNPVTAYTSRRKKPKWKKKKHKHKRR